MAKLFALKRCFRLCRYGANLASRSVLFRIGVTTQLDYKKRRISIERLHSSLRRNARDGLLRLAFRGTRGVPGAFPVLLRADDSADYQSLFECLATDMYPPPEVSVRHILDGGANLGFFALGAIYGTQVVDLVLVEPHPGNVRLLRRNVEQLRRFGVATTVHEVALGPAQGVMRFHLCSSNTSHADESVGHEGRPVRTTITVKSERITNLLPTKWDMRHTWLKLDIEGAEYGVIQDLLTSGLRPAVISAELHDYLRAGGKAVVEDLEAVGYRVHCAGVGNTGNVCRQINALYGKYAQ